MPTDTSQQTPQQRRKPTIVYTRHDHQVVTEIIEANGHVGTIELRQIPDNIANTAMFVRMMALRVVRYGRRIIMDEHIHDVHVLAISEMIPEHRRHDLIALSLRGSNHLPITTVQVPTI